MEILTADIIGDMALVLALSSLLGMIARRIGQPRVVGQILAGILLGPSVLGRLPGHLTGRLFPHAVLPVLNAFAQVAIVIFMFVVGYELNWRVLRDRKRAVPLVSAAALLVPMAIGSGVTLVLRPVFAAAGQTHISQSFVLFMGIAVSITAFPVLAAIMRERGITGTVAGATATGAAGIMDVVAWLMLAWVLVGTTSHPVLAWPWPVLLLGLFTLIMLGVVRPALRWWIRGPGSLLSSQIPIAIALALGSAWVTTRLGLHPIFGGFLAGITMPTREGKPDPDVLQPMEELGSVLLPLFFAVTGLSLNLQTMNGAAFGLLALVCAIAGLGKLGPGYLASRLGGLARRDAVTVAVLVNARGLTELIALSVGLSAGIIGQRLYAVLVLMALIMTAATTPMLSLIRSPGQPPAGNPDGSAPLPTMTADMAQRP